MTASKKHTLTQRQWTAIELELKGTRPEAIWSHPEVNVTRATWYRWHESPFFCAELLRARRQGLEHAQNEWMAELKTAMEQSRTARRVLARLAEDPKVTDRDQIRASTELGRLADSVVESVLAIKLPEVEEQKTNDPEAAAVAKVLGAIHRLATDDPGPMAPQRASR